MQSTPERRIHCLDDKSIKLLAHATVRVSERQNGWLWFPGSSNVFRRSLFETAMNLSPPEVQVRHFSDTFFLGTIHFLGGTAFIDLPLSVYRRHDQNTENASGLMKLTGLKVQKQGAHDRAIDQRERMCAALLKDPAALHPWVNDANFWIAADHLLRVSDKERRFHYGSQILRTAVATQLLCFAKRFGVFSTLERLKERMSFSDILRCVIMSFYMAMRRGKAWQIRRQ